MVYDCYCIRTPTKVKILLYSDAISLLNVLLESFRQVAELQTCPLKLCLQKLLAADELLSQTLHPHRCLHQTLMQTNILLLQPPVTGIKTHLVSPAGHYGILMGL